MELEYTAALEAVSEALARVEPPGAWATAASIPAYAPPGLVVPELGDVGLPLSPAGATALAARCHLAPYGRGEETLVDTAVRRTWELDAGAFALANAPAWNAHVLEHVLAAVRRGLGVAPRTVVAARLYKLLLYEPGGKFTRHRDTEKEPGMFATLVIALPSRFTGGELRVHGPGKSAGAAPASTSSHGCFTWDPAAGNVYDVKYAAFYADCEHEVLPVTSGHRLCLTYNLVTTSATPPSAARCNALYQRLHGPLCRMLGIAPRKRQRTTDAGVTNDENDENDDEDDEADDESEDPDDGDVEPVRQFVYKLDHRYTQTGLSFELLKNRDRVIAECLGHFCKQSAGEFVLYLCKLRYEYQHDEFDEFDAPSERRVSVSGPWIRHATNSSLPFSTLEVEMASELAPAGCLEEVKFDGSETEHTGNAGTIVENWYTAAALVIIPTAEEVKMIARTSPAQALPVLREMVDANSPHLHGIIATFFSQSHQWSENGDRFAKYLDLIEQLDDVSALTKVLTGDLEYRPRLAASIRHFGWERAWPAIAAGTGRMSLRSRVNLICSIFHDGDARAEDPSRIPTALAILPAPQPTRVNAKPLSSQDLLRLFRVASVVAAETVVSCSMLAASPVNVIVPALVAFLRALDPSARSPVLLDRARQLRLEIAAGIPAAMSMFRDDASRICQYCGCRDCKLLVQFLESPTQQLRLVRGRAGRRHIHETLDSSVRGMTTHVTEWINGQETLVITKRQGTRPTVAACRQAMAALDSILDNRSTPPIALLDPAARMPEVIVLDDDSE